MAQREILLPWLQQPQEAVELDRDGLGKGVQMLLMPMGGTLVDLVNPQQVWTPSGNAAIEPSTGGMAAALDGTDDFWSATGYPNITGNVGTFFLWCPEIGSPDSYGHVWFGTNTTSALWFQVYPTASNVAAAFGQDITGIGVGSSIFNSTNTALAWSSDGTAAGKRFFFNGTSYGTPNGAAPTAFASGTKSVRFGAWIGGNSWDCSGKAVIAGFTTDVWTAEHARLFYENPWQLFAQQSIWVPVSAGGGPTPVGLSAETDASLSLPAVQIKALGRADETDTAIALPAVQVAATGVAVEVDSAFALAAVQLQSVGLATETDTALALAAGSANAAGLAEETDSAIALAGVQITATGIALETDAALALTGIAGTAPGVAAETDAALALAAVQKMATGLAAETDEALAPGAAAADVVISLGGRRRKRDWRSFDVMPHWTPPDADGDMSDGEPVPPEEDAEPVKARSALSMGLEGSGDALAPVEPAAAVVEVVPEPEAKPLTLADVITRDDLTHDELVQAIQLLARAQSGGLVRSTPRLTLRRVS